MNIIAGSLENAGQIALLAVHQVTWPGPPLPHPLAQQGVRAVALGLQEQLQDGLVVMHENEPIETMNYI